MVFSVEAMLITRSCPTTFHQFSCLSWQINGAETDHQIDMNERRELGSRKRLPNVREVGHVEAAGRLTTSFRHQLFSFVTTG